jgi:hypothetical protein
MGIIGFVIALIVAGFVYSDADNLRKGGARLSPLVWAFVVWAMCLICLPLYLVLRLTVWRRQIAAAKGLPAQPLSAGQGVAVGALVCVIVFGTLLTVGVMALAWGLWEI